MKIRKKLIKTVLAWVVMVVVGLLFVRTLAKNWQNLQGISLRPDVWIILSIIAFVLSIITSGIFWGRVVNKLIGVKVPVLEAIRIHLASWLLKYIPGQAGSLLNKLAWAKDKGIDGKKITASFIYENTFLLIASTATTIPLLLIGLSDKFSDNPRLFWPLLLSLPLVVVIVLPRPFSFLLNFLFKLLKKQPLAKDELLTTRDNLIFSLEFIIPRILNGLAFVFIAISLLGIPPSQYHIFWAIYVLAGIIGLLAIFVPSGLGVREAVITLFASAYVPVEQAVALALLSRFYATIADIFVAIIYTVLRNMKGAKT